MRLAKRIRRWRRDLQHPRRPIRRGFFRIARRFTATVAAPSKHGDVLVSTRDTGFGPNLFARGDRKEYRTLEHALDALRAVGQPATGVFVDAGAHVGTTTLAALAAGFEAVIALEPSPDTCRLLRANVALNGAHDQVVVIEAALSDSGGTATLDVGKGSASKHRILDGEPARGRTIDVRLTTLDDLVQAGSIPVDDVGFLWIDVEGHEPHVLLGGSMLLERGVPIVAEVNPKLGDVDVATKMLAVLERHYTHVRDLGPRSSGRFEPVSQLVPIAELYGADHKFTDVLLVRLSGSRADR